MRRYCLCKDAAAFDGCKGSRIRCHPALPLLTKVTGKSRGDIRSRPHHHDHVRKLEQLAPAMPRRQSEQCIGANDERQRLERPLLVEFLERAHGVAAAGPINFAGIEGEARTFFDGKLHHGQPVVCRCDGSGTVRRITRGYEQYLFKAERRSHFAGELQMAEVNGIEGAAQNAERAAHARSAVIRTRVLPRIVHNGSGTPRLRSETPVASGTRFLPVSTRA